MPGNSETSRITEASTVPDLSTQNHLSLSATFAVFFFRFLGRFAFFRAAAVFAGLDRLPSALMARRISSCSFMLSILTVSVARWQASLAGLFWQVIPRSLKRGAGWVVINCLTAQLARRSLPVGRVGVRSLQTWVDILRTDAPEKFLFCYLA